MEARITMKALLRISLCCAVLSIPLLLQPLSALADATEPVADIPGARDPAPLKRYEGAFIVSFEQREYARLSIPLSALKPSVDSSEYDSHNNRVHRPENSETLEGKVTRVVYVLPAQRSPLEVVRNYEDEIAALGGETRFECLREACGGDAHRATAGGGGKTSLMMQFLHESNVKDAAFSNGNCALTSRIDDQHYIAATWPKGNHTGWLTVHAYQLDPNQYCKALGGRTVAVVHVVEPRVRESRMVEVKAEEMASSLDSDGSIALYGIYFDTNEARIKPESDQTLQEIVTLLQQQRELTLLVVGHTDSQGSYAHNLTLSDQRAQAVKAELVKRGVAEARLSTAGAGMMAPVATNSTEEGRAKNRRVALVKLP